MADGQARAPSEGSFRAMITLIRSRLDFRRLMIGNMISQLGEWLSYIAVSLLTVSSGEGGVALATAYLSHSLPNALVAPLAGRVADRFDRRKVMIYAYLAASLVTGLMLISAMKGDIWTLQALTFLRTSLSSFGMTARQASIPSLVSQRELYTANALNSLIWSTLFTLGVALGGALGVLALALIALLATAALIRGLLVRLPMPAPLIPALQACLACTGRRKHRHRLK